jgi:hypothetical protein
MTTSSARRKRRLLGQTGVTAQSSPSLAEDPWTAGQDMLRSLLLSIGAAVQFEAGIAVATITLRKARAEISREEAAGALAGVWSNQNSLDRGRLVRAASLAALEKIRGDILGDELVDALALSLRALDAEGLAVLGALPTREGEHVRTTETEDGSA